MIEIISSYLVGPTQGPGYTRERWSENADRVRLQAADDMMKKQDDDMQVFAGQLVAQDMLIQILMAQIVQGLPDRGASVRDALVHGTQAIRSNPNMTDTERFGAVKTLEGALDTLDRINAHDHRG